MGELLGSGGGVVDRSLLKMKYDITIMFVSVIDDTNKKVLWKCYIENIISYYTKTNSYQ